MQTTIRFQNYHSSGKAEILRALSYFAGFDRLIDCATVRHLDILIKLRLQDYPEHMKRVVEYYERNLREKEVIKYFSSTKKLSIEFLSRLPNSSYESFLEEGDRVLRYETSDVAESIRNYRSRMATIERLSLNQEFEYLVHEIYELFSKKRKALIKKCSIDFKPILDEIDANAVNLPKDFVATWELIHRAQSWEAQREWIDEERPLYHREPLPGAFKVNRMEPASMFVGRTSSDEQFWSRVAVVHSFDQTSYQSVRTWYAVLHRFNSVGDHIETRVKKLGTNFDDEKIIAVQAQFEIEKFVSDLGHTEPGPIFIKLFDFEFDGSQFGLEDTSTEEFGNEVTLHPGDINFTPPWDGEYDFGMYTIDWMQFSKGVETAD